MKRDTVRGWIQWSGRIENDSYAEMRGMRRHILHVDYTRENNSQAKQTVGSETSREGDFKNGIQRGDGDIRKNYEKKGGIELKLKIGVK